MPGQPGSGIGSIGAVPFFFCRGEEVLVSNFYKAGARRSGMASVFKQTLSHDTAADARSWEGYITPEKLMTLCGVSLKKHAPTHLDLCVPEIALYIPIPPPSPDSCPSGFVLRNCSPCAHYLGCLIPSVLFIPSLQFIVVILLPHMVSQFIYKCFSGTPTI